MEQRFSDRVGVTAVRSQVQMDSMDNALKNGLWNIIYQVLIGEMGSHPFVGGSCSSANTFYLKMWVLFFKDKLQLIPRLNSDRLESLFKWFDKAQWWEVYNFIEFMVIELPSTKRYFEAVLKRELSGFRFIDGILVAITSEEEIQEIESIQNASGKFSPVKKHLNASISLFSDRSRPDYRNSIKESISAVEALCRIIAGDDKAELGAALKIIDDKHKLHGALKKAFMQLYGYTSDAGGIRHSLLEDSVEVTFDDAKFMLVSCSAFINYLIAKTSV